MRILLKCNMQRFAPSIIAGPWRNPSQLIWTLLWTCWPQFNLHSETNLHDNQVALSTWPFLSTMLSTLRCNNSELCYMLVCLEVTTTFICKIYMGRGRWTFIEINLEPKKILERCNDFFWFSGPAPCAEVAINPANSSLSGAPISSPGGMVCHPLRLITWLHQCTPVHIMRILLLFIQVGYGYLMINFLSYIQVYRYTFQIPSYCT